MHRFGERLMYCAPLLFVLAGGCSSDELPATSLIDGGLLDAGTTGLDAVAPPVGTTTITIPIIRVRHMRSPLLFRDQR